MDGVGPDTLGSVLDSRGLGEYAYRSLGRVVGWLRNLVADDAGDLRDVDDGASSSLTHLRNDSFRPEEHALGVHVHDQVPGFGVGVLHRS